MTGFDLRPKGTLTERPFTRGACSKCGKSLLSVFSYHCVHCPTLATHIQLKARRFLRDMSKGGPRPGDTVRIRISAKTGLLWRAGDRRGWTDIEGRVIYRGPLIERSYSLVVDDPPKYRKELWESHWHYQDLAVTFDLAGTQEDIPGYLMFWEHWNSESPNREEDHLIVAYYIGEVDLDADRNIWYYHIHPSRLIPIKKKSLRT